MFGVIDLTSRPFSLSEQMMQIKKKAVMSLMETTATQTGCVSVEQRLTSGCVSVNTACLYLFNGGCSNTNKATVLKLKMIISSVLREPSCI